MIFAVFDKATGRIVSHRTCDPTRIAQQVPAGCGYVAGRHDPHSQRVDVTTGQVVDYQPPAPDEDHEWNANAKRWVLKSDAADARAAHLDALTRLAELDAKAIRALSDHALSVPGAAQRLADIEGEKAALRPKVLKKHLAERPPLKAR